MKVSNFRLIFCGLKKRSAIVLIMAFAMSNLHSQTIPSSRITDWTLAGLRDTTTPQNLIVFSGVGDGTTDHSSALTTLLAGLSQPTIIQFEAGVFLFNSGITLPSNVVIRGKGFGVTNFKFNLSGASTNCFSITGSEAGTEYAFSANAAKGDMSIQASTNPVSAGYYIRIKFDDASLTNDSWANGFISQICKVTGVSGSQITLDSPLRMDYQISTNARFRIMNPVKNVGIECISIERVDQVTTEADRNKISKFKFNRAVNCWIKGVESINCNYAHVDATASANLLISGCYFRDAFEHGSGGRAYGVMLHLATSECRVENTIFKSLRHAMIMQAGANGNVFSYNYSIDAFKTWFLATLDSEDMVCHGNYVYLNLFEGNVGEYAKIDFSHGLNGPHNTYFRNRTSTGYGFNVSAGGGNDQNFVGNEGTKSLSNSGHLESFNSWQANSGTLETSLAYAAKPSFLTDLQFGGIGYGSFGISATNPAIDRYVATTYINEICGSHVWNGTAWDNSFIPDDQSQNFDLKIKSGSICLINSTTTANRIQVMPGGRLNVGSGFSFTLNDSIVLQSNETEYGQFLGDFSWPAVYYMTLTETGWHHITSPLSGVQLDQLESGLKINYAGNPNGASAFTWNPTSGMYDAVVNSSASLSGKAINLFADDFLVKTGKGMNADGMLPIQLRFTGNLNNGSIANSTMAYGVAQSPTGTIPDGWNHMFNPYPSSIDLDIVFNSLPTGYEAGAHVYDAQSGTFEVRTLSSINNGNSTAVAPGQSFFVRITNSANPNSGFYNFNNSVRILSNIAPFYKTQSTSYSVHLRSGSEILSSAHLYSELGFDEYYDPNKDISTLQTGEEKGAISVLKPIQNNSKRQYLNIAAIHAEEISSPLPLAIFVKQSGKFTLDVIGNEDAPQLYILDSESERIWHHAQTEEIDLQAGWHTNRFFILGDHPMIHQEADPIVQFQNGKLKLSLPDHMSGRIEVSIYSTSGALVFHSGVAQAAAQQQFEMPNLKSGVYIVSFWHSGSVYNQKLIF